MVFKRNRKLTRFEMLKEFVWPRMGWRRMGKYLRLRVLRLKGTSYAIAAGLASGIAVSFTPFFGFHLILGLAVTYLIRGNLLATALGTLVGNPWTFPIMWNLSNLTGKWVFSTLNFHPSPMAEGASLWLMETGFGGFLLAVTVWPFAFALSYYVIFKAKRARRLKRLKIWEERAGVAPPYPSHETEDRK